MKVTKVQTLVSKQPLVLPEPWRAAWRGPDAPPITSFEFSFYKVYTDEGIVGVGPCTGHPDPGTLIGYDPYRVEAFYEAEMSGRRSGNSGRGAAGLEMALWDIIGKAANLPLYKLLGARTNRIRVYAATSRLLDEHAMLEEVLSLKEQGYQAVKLRLHRQDPTEDLAVVETVADEVGDDMMILVDANQNNAGEGYEFWSRQTAQRMALALDDLQVYYLEEPLPRPDIEGLAEIAASVDMFIAGGEHTPTVYDFREHLARGAYDIIQPDVILGGNYGISGIRKAALLADYAGRLIVPHVMSGSHNAMGIAGTIHAMATVGNCPLVEYPCDPPILTPETSQAAVQEPIRVDADGYITIPERPGLGVTLDEAQLVVKAQYS